MQPSRACLRHLGQVVRRTQRLYSAQNVKIDHTAAAYSSKDAAEHEGIAKVRGLHRPEDFRVLAQSAAQECEIARQRVVQGSSGGPLEELRDLDSISNIVCSVVDAAEFIRNTHADPAFRAAAEEAFMLLT